MDMDLARTLTKPDNMFTAFVALITFATVLTVGMPMLNRSSLESRLKSVANRREELRRRSREALANKAASSSLRQTDESVYKRVVDRLHLSRLLEDATVVDKLAQAGFRGPRPVSTFYFFRFVTPFILASFAAFYLLVINGFGLPMLQKLTACVAAMVIGYYAPNIYISNVGTKRRDSIGQAFPHRLRLPLIFW